VNGSAKRSSQAHVPVPSVARADASLLGILEGLRVHPERVRKVSAAPIMIAVLDSSPDVREAWLGELARYQRACGCNLGAGGAISGFVAATAWQVTRIRQLTAGVIVADTLEVLGAALLCGILGKLLGLALARTRFQRATDAFIGHVSRPTNNGVGSQSLLPH